LLLLIIIIIHIKYVKPALTRGLTARDCGGLQFMEVPGQVPTLSCPKSDLDLCSSNYSPHVR